MFEPDNAKGIAPPAGLSGVMRGKPASTVNSRESCSLQVSARVGLPGRPLNGEMRAKHQSAGRDCVRHQCSCRMRQRRRALPCYASDRNGSQRFRFYHRVKHMGGAGNVVYTPLRAALVF